MKWQHWLTVAAAGLTSMGAMAQQQARVLASTPVWQNVALQQQHCYDEVAQGRTGTSGTGAVLGAIIGGVAGNALGRGGHHGRHGYYTPSNRGATTAVGAIAGGLIGNSIENANRGYEPQTVRRCTGQPQYEQQLIGYDVTYEYGGRRYTTRMDRAPGAWIPVSAPVQQGTYSSQPPAGYFVGPSGVYRSAPPGGAVMDHATNGYQPPIVVDMQEPPPPYPHRPPHWQGGYPSHPWR